MKNKIKDIFIITFGSLLYAVGVSIFLQPNSIAPGGFSGMAVIVNHFTKIPTGTLIIIFNTPLAIVGYKKLGRIFMTYTVYAILISSFIMNFLSANVYFETEPLLGALYGGIFMGIGLGFTFSTGGSTGGFDIISKIIQVSKPHLSLGQIMVCLDMIVVTISAIAFGTINSALYAVVSLWLCSKLIDSVIEGPDLAKLIYIISDKNDEIATEICLKLKRGATILNGTGAYTKGPKNVIICAVRRHQIPQIKKIASSIDKNSFMIVTDVREVLGDGFKMGGKKV